MSRKVLFPFLLGAVAVILAACGGLVSENYAPEIDPANFTTLVDNPYFPLTPGTTYIYEGETAEGTERVEVVVTHDTQVVMGVTCIEVRDTVYLNGEVIEDTFDWYAQDNQGNVWYFGEDTKEYENGQVVSTAGTWKGGVDGAQPGIIMLAQPEVGHLYRQEYYAGEAEDMAEVISISESATVAYGSYDNLVMTREWTPLTLGLAENKYYAQGIGLVLEVMVEGGSERIELIDIQTE